MSRVCMVTALAIEAKPLIGHFRLQSIAHRHLRLHGNDKLMVLATGTGKLAAASATAAMLEACPDVKAVISTGIAGSKQPLETVLVSRSIHDKASGRTWYPHLPPIRALSGANYTDLVTVDSPCTDYTGTAAFDMEAAGVVTAATAQLDLAFVHAVKVVSDNPQHGIDTIDKARIGTCMTACIPGIEKLIAAMPFEHIADTTSIDNLCADIFARLHCTRTQQHDLKHLLTRYRACHEQLPDWHTLAEHESAGGLIRALQTSLQAGLGDNA